MSEIIKLSRSTVEKYISCPRCCVLDKKYQIKPPSLPFTLNIAVDNLCKNEFDYYRKIQEPHPLFIQHDIDAVPFKHRDLESWRSNFQGIRYKSIEHNFDFGGAVDDIWQKKNGDLIIIDVKATSRNNFDWPETFKKYEYAKAYKRQLEMYQWLFKKNGFQVAKEAYLLYFNGKKNEELFNNQLNFDVHLIKLDCATSWVENKIIDTVNLLRSDDFPKPSLNCEYCNYLKKRWQLSIT
ncbi:hypothetical protein P9215_00451 [Prochlorococcus marinus str. MIT 9215]|uniref:PD-(D/E)XK endonuclease-like domain-containing protein n=1 Tax=Prochlorococcus marinus (strain MIT 9215) TaxID=93060 RepID=A8G233_PROM2|nr:PD-(D/E)XK nuclease family protein [Prochlorococcus marinus]ABV49664.1 hypothetical protein P9215_00451 [Prochlorococcus marinus str. MIT 9215]